MNRPTPREAVSDSVVMARRELIAGVRRPELLILSFIQPVILILIFRYVFGGAIQTPDGSYVNYLVPGILLMTAIFGSITTGIGLSEDLSKGLSTACAPCRWRARPHWSAARSRTSCETPAACC
jgi:hypothetical protein